MAATEEFLSLTSKKIPINSETLLRFIELYRKNECLWNIRLEDYKKFEKRKNAMTEIALECGLTVDFVKKKIQSLRSTYMQEKKKIDESKTTGTGSDTVYKPQLFWFHELDFLQDVIVPRKTTSNLNNNTQISTSPEENILSTESQQPGTSKEPVVPKTFFKNAEVKKKFKKNNNSENEEDKCIKMALENLSQITTQNDEFEAFGTSIAAQLRALPLSEAIELQMDIQQIISRKRLQFLQQRKLSCNVSDPSTPSFSASPSVVSSPMQSPVPHWSSNEHLSHQSQYSQNNEEMPLVYSSPDDVLYQSISMSGINSEETY